MQGSEDSYYTARAERRRSSVARYLSDIIRSAHGQRIGGLRFVDREEEIASVIGGEKIPLGKVTILYGPKGCGKTTLFDVISGEPVEGILDIAGIDLIFIGADEGGFLNRVKVPEGITRILESSGISRERDPGVRLLLPFGGVAADIQLDMRGVFSLIQRVVETLRGYVLGRRRERDLLIVFDEIRASSPEHVSMLDSMLNKFADLVRSYDDEYVRSGGGSIGVVILTSDAIASKVEMDLGGKVNWALMWNLPREAARDVAIQLGLLRGGEAGIEDLLWRLAGGNPRALEEIAGSAGDTVEKKIGVWLEKKIDEHIFPAIQKLARVYGVGDLYRYLEEVVWDPDKMVRWAISYHDYVEQAWLRIERITITEELLKHNIAINIQAAISTPSKISREPWVGRKYAFQIPAYYYALKAVARKRSLEVSLEDILRTAIAEEKGSL